MVKFNGKCNHIFEYQVILLFQMNKTLLSLKYTIYKSYPQSSMVTNHRGRTCVPLITTACIENSLTRSWIVQLAVSSISNTSAGHQNYWLMQVRYQCLCVRAVPIIIPRVAKDGPYFFAPLFPNDFLSLNLSILTLCISLFIAAFPAYQQKCNWTWPPNTKKMLQTHPPPMRTIIGTTLICRLVRLVFMFPDFTGTCMCIFQEAPTPTSLAGAGGWVEPTWTCVTGVGHPQGLVNVPALWRTSVKPMWKLVTVMQVSVKTCALHFLWKLLINLWIQLCTIYWLSII